jgi:septal ring factor EnvC (AmiA/AmiB activator)
MNSPLSREELDAKLTTISSVSDERWHLMLQVTTEIRESVRKLHITVILTGISVVIGVAGVNSSLLSGVVGAFESGQGMGRQAEVVNKRMEGMEQRLGGVEQKVGGVERRIEGVEQKIGKLETGVEDLNASLRADMAKHDAQLRSEMTERDARLRAEMNQRFDAQQKEIRAIRESVDRIAAHLGSQR